MFDLRTVTMLRSDLAGGALAGSVVILAALGTGGSHQLEQPGEIRRPQTLPRSWRRVPVTRPTPAPSLASLSHVPVISPGCNGETDASESAPSSLS
jgi:hypothetical protein